MFIDAAACIEISPQRGAYGLLTVNSLFLCSIFGACCLKFGQMRELVSKETLRIIILSALCWPIFLIKIQKWIFLDACTKTLNMVIATGMKLSPLSYANKNNLVGNNICSHLSKRYRFDPLFLYIICRVGPYSNILYDAHPLLTESND